MWFGDESAVVAVAALEGLGEALLFCASGIIVLALSSSPLRLDEVLFSPLSFVLHFFKAFYISAVSALYKSRSSSSVPIRPSRSWIRACNSSTSAARL